MKTIGVKNILLRYKVSAAVTALCILIFVPTAMLFALTPPPGTPIVNTASLTFQDSNGNSFPQITASVQTPVSQAPVLVVNKTASSNPVSMGSTITYTLTVTNTGNISSGDVVLTDYLSKHIEFQSASSGGIYTPGPPEGGSVVWNIGPLLSGQTKTYTVTARVKTPSDYSPGDPDTIANGTLITNTAVAVSPETSNSTTIQTVVGESPNICISQTVSTTISAPGGILTYTIKYGNSGNTTAHGVFIRNEIPAGTSIVEDSITGSGILSNNAITWFIGELQPGETGSVSFSVRVSTLAKKGDIITNSPVINSIEQSSKICSSVYTIISDGEASIEITKVGTPSKVFRNDEITYTITVKNNGSQKLTGVFITDPIPSNTVFISADNSGIFTGTQVIWNIGTLEPADSKTFTLVVKVSSEAIVGVDIINTVSLQCDQLATISATAVNSVTNRTNGQIEFFDEYGSPKTIFNTGDTLYIQVTDTDQNLDSTIAETIIVVLTNESTGDSETITLTETGPDTGIFIGSTPTNTGTSENNNGILTVATNSRVSAVYTDILDEIPTITVYVYIEPVESKLTITKSVSCETVTIGDIIEYKITLENSGIIPITNITVTDIMPHGIVYVSGSTRINNQKTSEPSTPAARNLVWNITEMPGNTSVEISYLAIVGVDSQKGDGKNTVFASGTILTNSIKSNISICTVKINEGVFTSKGTIIGKVFVDKNNNKIQDEGEPGVGNVSIYMQDGARVITDKEGKYSIPAVNPGTYVLRVDETTLPEGMKPASVSNRFAGSSVSQFVDMVPGGLVKANFAVNQKDSNKDGQKEPPEKEEPSAKPQEEKKTNYTVEEKKKMMEKEILTMNNELAFIYPEENSLISGDSVNVMLKAPMEVSLLLYVNNNKVDDSRIGMKIENKEGKVIVYEFIGVTLNSGERNTIKAITKDQFGNIRETKEISVLTTGKPHKIVVRAKQKNIPADGMSMVEVEAFVQDKNNNNLVYPLTMTVDTSAGEIVEKDVDPYSPGIQVLCKKGRAVFNVKSPTKPSNATIRVFFDELKGEDFVFFAPHLRPMLKVGYGELILGYGTTKGNTSLLNKDWLQKGFSKDGRAAFFIKGEIGKGFLLTTAYDSGKEKQKDFFNEHTYNAENEDRYPIYGDESKLEYEAQSREKLYIRIDREHSYIMYGDIQTGFTDSKLSAYPRTFTGLKSELNSEKLSLHFFLTHTDQIQKIDIIQGKGISGYYYLSSRPVIEGSERVLIEIRDRNRPENVLKRETKIRGNDYVMDYDIGGILFKSTIPSFDSEFNPVYIVVIYETTGTEKKYHIAGARLTLNPLKWIKIGLTGVKEEQNIDDKTIIGADITLKLPGKTTVKTEWAHTHSIFDIGNIYKAKSDVGWMIELNSNPVENLLLSAYFRKTGDYFGNNLAYDFARGMEKYGIDAKWNISEKTWIKATFYSEEDRINDMEHNYSGIGFGKEFNKTRFEIEAYKESANDNYIPPTNPDSRHPFDISEETPEEAAGLKIKVEHKFNPALSFGIEHKQNLISTDGTITKAGLDYIIGTGRKFYLRQEIGQFAGRSESRTAIGTEVAVTPSMNAFNEYRLSSGIDGNSVYRSIGLRNNFSIAKSITGNLSIERIDTLKGNERQSYPDGFAAAVAFEYLPKEKFKITSRLEYREQKSESSNLIELGTVFSLNPDYSLLFRHRTFFNDITKGGEVLTSRTMLGVAYRPLHNDRFNALARIEFKTNKDTNSSIECDDNSYIASIEGNYQFNNKIQLTGKYAGKLAIAHGISSYTDLISGRIIYDITERVDIGIEARFLNSHKAGTICFGGNAEIGYRLVKNFWLSAGYSFDRFDEDLTGSLYSAKGPYLRLRFKLD